MMVPKHPIWEESAKGGKARARKLTRKRRKQISTLGIQARQRQTTKAQRQAIARKAALARWAKRRAPKEA